MEADEMSELQACILQLTATNGMYSPRSMYVEQLDRQIVGYSEREISAAAASLADEHDWATFSNSKFTITDREEALRTATELRTDVYG
ncbi:hypothetical protein [Natronomonas sp. EA1]|uniref:hypothetical protein n=1 Tax=Natronomonas sp. EA1 TaxID=3421655 RepID=UPI003EBD25C1